MTVGEIVNSMNEWAPSGYQESYDNAQLIVGNRSQKVENVLVSLDCIEEVVEEAIEKNCQMIISHHPIVFKGLKSLTGSNYVERTVIEALKNNISLFAIHTNLDNVYTGVNFKIAEKLGIEKPAILVPKSGTLKKLFTFIPVNHLEKVRESIFQSGAGEIGDYSSCSFSVVGEGTFKAGTTANPFVGEVGNLHKEKEAKVEMVFPSAYQSKIIDALLTHHPYEEVAYDVVSLENPHPQIGAGMVGELKDSVNEEVFLKRVKETFGCKVIRHTELRKKEIKRIAFCGGAGSFLLSHAKRVKADVFITGDFKYHEFFDAEKNIVIMDIGHFESEQFTVDLITDYLTRKFTTFAVHLSKVNTNPVHYFS